MRGEDLEQQPSPGGLRWGFGVLAAVIVLIAIGWALSNNGRGWGESEHMAHMMPPGANAIDGPASRAWKPNKP